jgi:hypothetical protein
MTGHGGPQPSPDEVRQALIHFVNVYSAAVNQARARLVEAWRPFMEWAASPAGRALLAAHAAERTQAEQGCHCLCFRNHPGSRPCQGFVRAAEVVTVRFGATDVPMCAACAEAFSDGR